MKHETVRTLDFQGLPISIETDAGQFRHWYDPKAGENGKTQMLYPYGYVSGTLGLDGDEVDVYVGPNHASSKVYVVTQLQRFEFQEIDEQKVMLGFNNPIEAKTAYLQHFNSARFFGSMKELTMEEFKQKLKTLRGKLIKSSLIKAKDSARMEHNMLYLDLNKGLWDNIHAKRKRGEEPAKPGDDEYPSDQALEDSKKAINKAVSDKISRMLKEYGLEGVNKPKMTPSHPKKKAVVLAKEGDKVKLIRFGEKGYGHNYSSEARSSFKARHAADIKRGKMSAAYWADKFLWGGPGAKAKSPPKGQKHVKKSTEDDVHKSLEEANDIIKALRAATISGLTKRERLNAAYQLGITEGKKTSVFNAEPAVLSHEELDVGLDKSRTRPLHEPPAVPVRRVETPYEIPAQVCGPSSHRSPEVGPKEALPFHKRGS